MDKLRNQILTQLDRFDSFEPRDGHMERFTRKLNPRRTGLLSGIPYAVKVAAILLLVAASSILIYEQVAWFFSKQNLTNPNEISTELSEVEYYYTSLIDEKYIAIDSFTSDNPEQNKILMEELEQMDPMFKSLQKDLQVNPTDERIIHAIINHYELKLEVMGQILSQLEQVQQINENKDYESTEI